MQITQNSQNNLLKNVIGRLTFHNFKVNYKTTVIKTL